MRLVPKTSGERFIGDIPLGHIVETSLSKYVLVKRGDTLKGLSADFALGIRADGEAHLIHVNIQAKDLGPCKSIEF